MYFGPWDVSGVVNRTSDINFALGISRNDHTNIGKLTFLQFSTIFNKMFKNWLRISIWLRIFIGLGYLFGLGYLLAMGRAHGQ